MLLVRQCESEASQVETGICSSFGAGTYSNYLIFSFVPVQLSDLWEVNSESDQNSYSECV